MWCFLGKFNEDSRMNEAVASVAIYVFLDNMKAEGRDEKIDQK
jgi:hypothetical protein